MNRPSIFREFWDFLRVSMNWWLEPIVLLLLVLGGLGLLAEGSALPPDGDCWL